MNSNNDNHDDVTAFDPIKEFETLSDFVDGDALDHQLKALKLEFDASAISDQDIRAALEQVKYVHFISEKDRTKLSQAREKAAIKVREQAQQIRKAVKRIEQDHEHAIDRALTLADQFKDINEAKLLHLREKALRAARDDLDKELAEIERRRAELNDE